MKIITLMPLLIMPALGYTQVLNWNDAVVRGLMDCQHLNPYSGRIIEQLLVEYEARYLEAAVASTVTDGQADDISIRPKIPFPYWTERGSLV